MKGKFKAIIAIISVIALFAAGTFAWEQIVSHTNEFIGKRDDVTIHDDFDPDIGKKDVYVENIGSVTLFVRLKLNEAMDLTSYTWRPGPGDWTAHTYGATPEDCGHANGAGKLFHDYFKWTMGGWKYYKPADGTAHVVHDTTVYTDADYNAGTAKMTPDAGIITVAQYLAKTADEQKEFIGWIYDTDGYAYWSQPLEKGDVTGLLLSRVDRSPSLKNTDYYYAIDVILEAVDKADIPMWTAGANPIEGGDKHSEATAGGKEVINIIVGNAGSGDGGGIIEPAPTNAPAPTGAPTPTDEPGHTGGGLPVNAPAGGFSPILNDDPDLGDGYYADVYFPDPTHANNKFYHNGAIHLEDIITDGNYENVTATAADAKYAPYITVGTCERHGGKPSVIFSYSATNEEWWDWVLSYGDSDLTIPVQVTLTRDGKTATVTINMKYPDCLITLADL